LSRFFLHQDLGNRILEDPEGMEAADLAIARQTAIELWANAILAGTRPIGKAFRITDAAGTVLLVVPFSEALPSSVPDRPSGL
jgi:hypothetical protein